MTNEIVPFVIAQPPLYPNATAMPPGLTPLRKLCSETDGAFFIETKHHMLAHLPGKDHLVVTFDNLASDREVDRRYAALAVLSPYAQTP